MPSYPPHNPRSSGKVIYLGKSSCILITRAPSFSAPCLIGSSFQGKPLQHRWTMSSFTSHVETVFIPKGNKTKSCNSKVILWNGITFSCSDLAIGWRQREITGMGWFMQVYNVILFWCWVCIAFLQIQTRLDTSVELVTISVNVSF